MLRRLNPLALIGRAAEWFAHLVDYLRCKANQRALARVAEVMGELATVNVLGVPGAGLESVRTARRSTTGSHCGTLHCSLHPGSPARLLGAVLDSLYAIPVAGQVIAEITAMMGRAFDALTDVRGPVGAATTVVITAALVRYSRAVERVAATIR